MNEQDKLIAEQLKTLPSELQSAIESSTWRNSVQEIGNVNGLNALQLESFEQETMFIIYAFEPPANYTSNLIRELGVSEDVANTLANIVNDKILNPIIDRSGIEKSKIPEIAPEIHPMVGDPIPPSPNASEGQGKMKPSSLPRVDERLRVEAGEPVMILNKEEARQVRASGSPAANPDKPADINAQKVSLPDYRYDGGKDPYREPLK